MGCFGACIFDYEADVSVEEQEEEAEEEEEEEEERRRRRKKKKKKKKKKEGRKRGSPILYIQTPDRPPQRLLLVI